MLSFLSKCDTRFSSFFCFIDIEYLSRCRWCLIVLIVKQQNHLLLQTAYPTVYGQFPQLPQQIAAVSSQREGKL